MKKTFYPLALASSLMFASLVNAGEVSQNVFEQHYPHVSQSIKATLYSIAKASVLLGLQSFQEESVEKHGLKLLKQLAQCTASFDTSSNLYAIQNYVQSNFSQAELNTLETYYASSAGQKDTARLKAYGDRYNVDAQMLQRLSQNFPTNYEFIEQNGEDGKKIEAFRGSELGIKFTAMVLSDNIPELAKAETDANDCVDKVQTQWEKEK